MQNSTGSEAGIIVVVILAILLTFAFVAYLGLRYLRKRHPNPKYIPTQPLKRRWQAWHPRGTRFPKEGYSARLQDNASVPTLHARSENRNSRASVMILPDIERAGTTETSAEGAAAMVDRRTSVRSVVTLPAYSRSVRETERVLGREGERDGVDIVLEQPETAEEEEAMRDEEMETLYQIRTQRRREIQEREQRRRQRSEARDRGDLDALRRLRHESALRAEERETTGAAAMVRDYRARSRERRVSSVSYADLGVARHDGSRVRANSNESDRPLLDSAASISGNALRPWATQSSLSVHHRDLSTSSLSEDEERQPPPFGHVGSDFEVVTLSQTHSRASSRGGQHLTSLSSLDTGADLGEHSIPSSNPPAYADDSFEDAPPYRSPDRENASVPETRGAQSQSPQDAPLLPVINHLPSIRVAEPTPIDPTGSVEWPSPTEVTQVNR